MKMMAAVALLMAAQDPGRSGPEAFDRTFALVKASPGEARWDEIEWTTSLWEGRKKAAAEGKPLFIWAANGNPIGLT
ncbi:MAG TPA: hypothetical protein VJB14_17020 [Planctomycetota bacterium]|nr:hypothetical protein [Planctomycetota bacterium]